MVEEKYIKRLKERYRITTIGCWEWIGTLRGTSGYGCLKINGKLIDTHTLSYQIHKGDIPFGMLICHRCDNRRCVNPDHLFLGTYKDNYQDAVLKGRIIKPNNIKHPSLRSYQVRKCRCDECRKIASLSRKKWKEKSKSENGKTLDLYIGRKQNRAQAIKTLDLKVGRYGRVSQESRAVA